MNPRRARVEVRFRGRNITRQIRSSLISFTYIDKACDEADELTIVLSDRSGRWRNRWYPMRVRGRNARLRAWITCDNWVNQGDRFRMYCGEFEVDSCEFSTSSSGDIFTIKALSTPASSSLRRQQKSRSWEGVTLRRVARDIARQNNMRLSYNVPGGDIVISRADQIRRSDLAFLTRLARDHGVAVKVANNRIVLFEESQFEQRPTVANYARRETGAVSGNRGRPGNIISMRLAHNISEVVDGCTVSYKDPRTGQLNQSTFRTPNASRSGASLQSNTRP